MSTQTKYGLTTTVNVPFAEAVEKVTAALKSEGFGILTEIDMQGTLKKKLDVDIQDYVILGACNPPLAYQALQNEQEIGLLLPCNVIVYTKDDTSHVAILDPSMMVSMTDNPALEAVATEARSRLERVISSL